MLVFRELFKCVCVWGGGGVVLLLVCFSLFKGCVGVATAVSCCQCRTLLQGVVMMLLLRCLAIFIEHCLLQECYDDVAIGLSCDVLRALSVAEV